MTSSSSPEHPHIPLPLKPIPGTNGFPIFGPIKDRYHYFYIQGRETFFRSRMAKYNSTVFRTNMPPGPFISSNSKVIVLLDALSFPILFDTTKVEKRNVLDGTYMPSLAFTGGIRTCAFLDPSETEHSVLKRHFLNFLASRHHQFIPLFRTSISEMFDKLEKELKNNNVANFNPVSDSASFDFIFRLLSDRSPNKNFISEGPGLVDRWLTMQLAPLATLGLPKIFSCFEDLIIHTFRLPFALVKSAYRKLYESFYESSGTFLDEAEKQGINREKACHNLVFLAGFNAYAGMKVLFPILLNWVGSAGEELHRKLVSEIRAAVKKDEGVTFGALEKMSLLKSVVYEVLRIDPPVPYQYARAKQDIVIENHDSAFKIKKGEMIFGYQPIATKDPKVFENAEEFVGDRFVGEKGEKLLKYVYWSNGRETEEPTAENKQCPARDLVVLMSRVVLVELFLRYDTFAVEGTRSSLGWSVKVKSLTKA
ncbi:allene oxide synthase 3-like [Cucumis melo var. makuwa]|uniref:Allene oxide synthase 3-like n=2 Tax=Cucumis melo TaxID=3656 RepID=A0A5A7SKU9_CUCMM|nr:allene oxide synthase 3-like [Cucumis melo]KAA0031258.1 allene oxide synthase 3-like [Cucumis melo var. makuwa]TYK06709.1 allene oxide synthase 3-like [Cucumis melo var. makuwa]